MIKILMLRKQWVGAAYSHDCLAPRWLSYS